MPIPPPHAPAQSIATCPAYCPEARGRAPGIRRKHHRGPPMGKSAEDAEAVRRVPREGGSPLEVLYKEICWLSVGLVHTTSEANLQV